jgi:hypothetical protein
MADVVTRYREWVERNIAEPNKRELLNRAIDAYAQASDAGRVTAAPVEPLVVAAKSRFTRVWESAMELLVRLTPKHPVVRDAMREMLNSNKVNERFNVVAGLKACVPKSLPIELIRRALNDKGSRVRGKAAEAADRLFLSELLPDLESTLASEGNPSAKENMEFHVAMLRDGYILRREEDGRPRLAVRIKRGWAMPPITQKDIDEGKLNIIVARTKARNE